MDSQHVVIAGKDRPTSLGRMCARGFRELNHDVTFVNTAPKTIPILGTKVGVPRMRRRFVETIAEVQPDLVFVIKGAELDPGTIERAKAVSDAVVCNWNPDNPFMARSTSRRLQTYLDALGCYDVAFIWSRELFDDLRAEGNREVRHLPFAYDPSIHHSVPPSKAYKSDVVFLGHWSEKRQRYLSSLLDLEIELAIYGNGWRRRCFDRALRRRVRDSAVFGEEYSRVMCSADIVLNIVADHNLEAYNMKSFEIPATGSFMLTSRTDGQRRLYGEGDGIACFETPEELRDKVQQYLDDDTMRTRIAKRGADIVSDHTYRNRMQSVIDQTI